MKVTNELVRKMIKARLVFVPFLLGLVMLAFFTHTPHRSHATVAPNVSASVVVDTSANVPVDALDARPGYVTQPADSVETEAEMNLRIKAYLRDH